MVERVRLARADATHGFRARICDAERRCETNFVRAATVAFDRAESACWVTESSYAVCLKRALLICGARRTDEARLCDVTLIEPRKSRHVAHSDEREAVRDECVEDALKIVRGIRMNVVEKKDATVLRAHLLHDPALHVAAKRVVDVLEGRALAHAATRLKAPVRAIDVPAK